MFLALFIDHSHRSMAERRYGTSLNKAAFNFCSFYDLSFLYYGDFAVLIYNVQKNKNPCSNFILASTTHIAPGEYYHMLPRYQGMLSKVHLWMHSDALGCICDT